MLLDKGKIDEVSTIFNGHYHLKAVYQERDMFHIYELVAFNTVMAHYFFEKHDLYMAHLYIKMLDQLEIPENMSLSLLLILKIHVVLLIEMVPVLREAKQSETKKQELIAQLVR